MNASITPLRPEEVNALSSLAGEIWRAHYPSIIGREQTEYMLQQRYARAVIASELERDDIWWDVLRLDNVMIGFASSFPGADGLRLDKLYVHSGHQRRGFGGELIKHVCERAATLGVGRVELAVNKRNGSAIAAYRKHRFEIVDSIVKDIGGGFVMDDYVMARRVE